MSLPDHLLDDDEVLCLSCGSWFIGVGVVCSGCLYDNIDLYADMKIQDEKEGK